MKCRRCETVHEVNDDSSYVYVRIPTKHHEPKFERSLEEDNNLFEKHDDYYIVAVKSFSRLIALLKRLYNKVERKDIMLLPLGNDKTLNYKHLINLKSLRDWVNYQSFKEVRVVLKKQKLKVLFQPIIDKNFNIYGHEALVRGLDENDNYIAPNILFDQAKKLDLLFNLDELCRTTVIKAAAKQNMKSKLFINFIPTSIYDPIHCLKKTAAAVKGTALTPEQIIFEVVESERIKDYDHLNNILNYYKDRGYHTALDDVGSGYTNQATIKALNADIIKIDQSIIHNIEQDQLKQDILKEYIKLAQANGSKILAEGVETKESFLYLLTLPIDYFQGYYIAKPMTNVNELKTYESLI